MQENAVLQTDICFVIAMGSSLLNCSMDDFSKVNETGVKEVSSFSLSERTR